MCDHGDTVDVQVPIPAHLSHSGQPEQRFKPIDRCLVGIVTALNAAEVWTIGSCCGHGKEPGEILLLDGRRLTIDVDPYRKCPSCGMAGGHMSNCLEAT